MHNVKVFAYKRLEYYKKSTEYIQLLTIFFCVHGFEAQFNKKFF